MSNLNNLSMNQQYIRRTGLMNNQIQTPGTSSNNRHDVVHLTRVHNRRTGSTKPLTLAQTFTAGVALLTISQILSSSLPSANAAPIPTSKGQASDNIHANDFMGSSNATASYTGNGMTNGGVTQNTTKILEASHSKADLADTAPHSRVKRGMGGKPVNKSESTVIVKVEAGQTCGGTVIDSHHVLTAAHCLTRKHKNKNKNVYAAQPEDVKICYGSLNRSDMILDGNEASPDLCHEVERVIIHKGYRNGYKDGTHFDDIALVKTKKTMNMSDVCRMPLPDKRTLTQLKSEKVEWEWSLQNSVEPNLHALGWGLTENGTNAEHLSHVDLHNVENKKYEAEFNDNIRTVHCESEKVICAGDMKNDATITVKDDPTGALRRATVCHGDSGGPIFYQKNNRLSFVGLTSNGAKPCGHLNPNAFTDVHSHQQWIKNSMGRARPKGKPCREITLSGVRHQVKKEGKKRGKQ